MPEIEGAFRHAALAGLTPVQSLPSEGGPTVVLARTSSGELAVVTLLVVGPIPPDVRASLAREGELRTRLAHDAIVGTKAIVLDDGLAAFVTEFVPGISLQRLLRFASGRGVRLPDKVAWLIIERVLAALSFAHGCTLGDTNGIEGPILHRSLAPTSVVVGWDGSAKVGDFGWSRVKSLIAPLGQLQIGGHGATALMAPEQARGAPVTDRSDVFCAALVALRIATGRTPYARFRDSATGVLLAMSEGKVPPLSKTRPDLPYAVCAAFDRALAADPEARDITARELHDVVRASFDLEAGKASVIKLLGRWREPLEQSMTPWEKRASMHDGAPEETGVPDAALALSSPDDRPSSDSLVNADPPDEPWRIDAKDTLASHDAALAPTGVATSLSRVGIVAPDALSIPPLPPEQSTVPSVAAAFGPPSSGRQGTGGPGAPPAPRKVTLLVAAVAVVLLLAAAAVVVLRMLRTS